jgi:hypothetical protein
MKISRQTDAKGWGAVMAVCAHTLPHQTLHSR